MNTTAATQPSQQTSEDGGWWFLVATILFLLFVVSGGPDYIGSIPLRNERAKMEKFLRETPVSSGDISASLRQWAGEYGVEWLDPEDFIGFPLREQYIHKGDGVYFQPPIIIRETHKSGNLEYSLRTIQTIEVWVDSSGVPAFALLFRGYEGFIPHP